MIDIHESPPRARQGNLDDREYATLLARIEHRFLANVRDGAEPVFKTNADLWWPYLGSFPAAVRQHHTCSTCRHFLERYGGLVTIDPVTGVTTPVFWHPNDAARRGSVDYDMLGQLVAVVGTAEVTGVFLSATPRWGTSMTQRREGEPAWRHFGFRAPSSMPSEHSGPKMAEKGQDFAQDRRALTEYRPEQLDQAVEFLRTDALYRGEKVLGPIAWLRDLQRAARASGRFDNVVWRAIATAPAGFCHPRSSMAGTLLEDLASGMTFADVARRFAAKMSPLQYQRPQAPPSAGNITAAEKLGVAGALRPSSISFKLTSTKSTG